ncbi:MAG: hypothetical protein ACTHOC_08620 [Luteimonas sp.]
MEVLSSRMTFYFKRIFPVVWLGFLVVFVVIGGMSGAWDKDPVFFVVPALMAVFGVIFFRMLLWTLADEVRDGGNFLVVRKGSVEERIPLADIINVGLSQFVNPRRLSLRLRRPGKLGDEIVFLPKQPALQFNPLARNAVAESLIKRVDAARQGAAR